jgi:hypothetical protein
MQLSRDASDTGLLDNPHAVRIIRDPGETSRVIYVMRLVRDPNVTLPDDPHVKQLT